MHKLLYFHFLSNLLVSAQTLSSVANLRFY